MKNFRRITVFCVIVIIFMQTCFIFAGSDNVYDDNKNEQVEAKGFEKIEDLYGKRIGSNVGSTYTQVANEMIKDCQVLEYVANSEIISELKNGNIDAYITDEAMAMSVVKQNEDLEILDEQLSHEEYGLILNYDNKDLCNDINHVISELWQDGTLDKLESKWMYGNSDPVIYIPENWDKSNGTLKVILSGQQEPFAYYNKNKIVGYDVEIMYIIAQSLGYDLQISDVRFDTFINIISSKRADIALGCITKTPSRSEKVLFTDSTYYGKTVLVIQNDNYVESKQPDNIFTGFYNVFIKEGNLRLILNGILVTLELSIFTMIFGTLLGFGFSFMLRSRNNIIRYLSNLLSIILHGIPILVILMIFFYIVFANSTVSAIIVGVIGLSLDFANVVAGIVETGITAVDKGEIEAAESLGYSRQQSFIKIVFPQMANHMFSQYIGATIGMIKGTSVIGYITVTDLTGAGDLIRNLTYEAFYPLVTVAICYFVIIRIFAMILEYIAKRIDPKCRKRMIKGVTIHD